MFKAVDALQYFEVVVGDLDSVAALLQQAVGSQLVGYSREYGSARTLCSIFATNIFQGTGYCRQNDSHA